MKLYRGLPLYIGIAILAVGCSRAIHPPGQSYAPLPHLRAVATSLKPREIPERVLHRFAGGPKDGAYPKGGLIAVGNWLYGTTSEGGSHNFGTVFSIDTTTGAERVLHSFEGSDGADPKGDLVNVGGRLYGTTMTTVFSIDTTGKLRVLHRFNGPPDGERVNGGLRAIGNTLYGTTLLGGAFDFGTIFSMTTTGVERVLHSFGHEKRGPYYQDCHGVAGGCAPLGDLSSAANLLFGTTSEGAKFSRGGVFQIDLDDGRFMVLHAFSWGPPQYACSYVWHSNDHCDGAFPRAGPTATFLVYGVTEKGGGYCLDSGGCGMIYAVEMATNKEQDRALHLFAGFPTDGSEPVGDLVWVKTPHTLYGTTLAGGSHCAPSGCGTIFRVGAPVRFGCYERPCDNRYKLLYSFAGGTDGAAPAGKLLPATTETRPTLFYGTTRNGGSTNCPLGCGTVFSLKLP